MLDFNDADQVLSAAPSDTLRDEIRAALADYP